MSYISEIFWNASIEEIKQGYVFDQEREVYVCVVCGKRYEKGIIYKDEDVLYEAEKYVRRHITSEHISMVDFLLGLDKKLTGLTDLQRTLLNFFQTGLSDQEIVKELDGGSTSTIRNHRFTLREKMKQAKVFLSIMELVEEKSNSKSRYIQIHDAPSLLDERHSITEEENDHILSSYFKHGLAGPMTEFPKKEKRKIVILRHLTQFFDVQRFYTEKEVNEILKHRLDDYVTLRRYLIEYGFMDREPDGSRYWVKSKQTN
ncbi:DUF2087 domain-containing protein [Paenibacillus crassostreae]|uniref:Transcriptional regulator n=1 Tax=Paenibacillus crassostreae TaxID=1763538 RepID=A0A167GE50_9BACL|nr:DUF2087 domain-containing protein [Paenibacillus crassostreae]AOZ92713.1 transcriptional regulator [Paenibacillus crassostreae]OAB77485.1 transcriptional regulator [Paenibacillus crassostreae]